jgi:glucose/arabinose dehydrogenase/mono/diheme cytochrome c family protein
MKTAARHWLGLVIIAAACAQAQPTHQLIFNFTNSWRFNQTTSYDGTNWTAPAFDDSALPSGRGVLALEDAGNPFVTARTNTALTLGRRTYYFRTTFVFTGHTAGIVLTFSNLVDDGAVFHLNGRELRRIFLPLPPAPITYTNLATSHDATAFETFTVAGPLVETNLVQGTNVLAVEVHQTTDASTDIVFGLALFATLADTNPPPTLRMPAEAPTFGFAFVNAFPGLTGLSGPTAMTTPPGETNRLFVLERGGRVTVITNLAAPNRTVVMDIASKIAPFVCEEGLLGLALHPGFATNGYFFLFYSTTNAATAVVGGTNSLHQRISRFQTTVPGGNSALTNTELVLITQYDQACNHNGGDLHFGPDGYLYASFGDEGNQGDTLNNSQTIRKDFFSGIIRIDVDKRPGNLPPNPHPSLGNATNYFVPADNPWVVANLVGELNPGGVKRTEFYAVGLRNPWRFSFDPVTDWLWCGDVGGSAREEVDIIISGGNYGWAFREGFGPGPKSNTGGNALNPIRDYPHGSGAGNTNVGNSITGGIVYYGTNIPQLTGWYVYADYTPPGNVWAMYYDGTTGTNSHNRALFQDPNIVAFGRDPRNGDVLAADLGDSQIKRLVYDTNVVIGELPPTLFNTGAFTNLNLLTNQTQALTPNSGVRPYDLNVAFWSDGAHKTRWFFMPTNNPKIGFNGEANWSLPAGMAWVKHFDLELTNGVPSSTRRLESRILVRNSNGVYGVTYRWGDSLTNATLVADAGLDEAFVINDGGNIRTQIWRYPSRAECNTCHAPAGGFALGFNTVQLNRDFGYAGGTSNQIAFMSAAGLFSNAVTEIHSLRALDAATNESASLEWRVRSYLAANCIQCHQPGGTALGNWNANITNFTVNAGLINGPLVNNGGNTNARVIAPGSLTNSMLLSRISVRGPGQMPPLASSVLDGQAIALVSRWLTNDLAGGSTNAIDPLSIHLATTNGNAAVQFIHPPNRAYRVETATNLAAPIQWRFLNVPENRPTYPASSNAVSVTDPTNAAQKFYRVRVSTP